MNHWQKTLYDSQINSEEMRPVFEDVIKSQEFRKFPPNPSEFVAAALFKRVVTTHQIPTPDQAFEQACRGGTTLHPLARHVRRKIGAWTLRTHINASVRSRFIALYLEAAEQLAAGKLSLKEEPKLVTNSKKEQHILSVDQLSDALSEI